MTTYDDAGVHLELGDDVSSILYNAAKLTWKNRSGKIGEVIAPVDDFSGLRAIDLSNLPKGTMMNIGFDGVGTKVEIAERMGNHTTVAYDLFGMVCDDAIMKGAEPVLLGSILDVNSLKNHDRDYIKEINQLAHGYIAAAKNANVAIINGEVAELGNRVGGFNNFNYNWGAAVVWFAQKDRLFTGHEIKAGDYLVALKEEGFRSNGLSLVRKLMQDKHGDEWHTSKFEGSTLGEKVLTPSRIYSKAVVAMNGGYANIPQAEIHGAVHITGGGIPGKLGRTLKPSGLGATISEPFAPPAIMRYAKELGLVSNKEAYRTWNMGQGMIIVTPDPAKVQEVARAHNITSKTIGQIDQREGIRIVYDGKILEF